MASTPPLPSPPRGRRCTRASPPPPPLRISSLLLPCLFSLLLLPSHASPDGIYGFGSNTVGLSDSAILQRLKILYSTKLRPLERKSHYNGLQEPALSDAWFDAKPVVMLLGQYSVGKTSFIRYLLGRDFPKQHIGPEPTTDGFLAVMYGDQDKTTPGNALTSQPDTPFHSLRRFGNALLDKVEAVYVPAPILRRITLVDTPGVQAGERQKGRGYDLLAVVKWWAQHADRIVLVFDPFKMSDISAEFRASIAWRLAFRGLLGQWKDNGNGHLGWWKEAREGRMREA